jgi:hypothetical protein
MWGQTEGRETVPWWGKDAELEPAIFAIFRKGVLAFLFLKTKVLIRGRR